MTFIVFRVAFKCNRGPILNQQIMNIIICAQCGKIGTISWTDPVPPPPEFRELFTTFGPANAFNLNGGMAVQDGGNPIQVSIAMQFTPTASGIVAAAELAMYRSGTGAQPGTLRKAWLHRSDAGKIGARLFDFIPTEVKQRSVSITGFEPVITRFQAPTDIPQHLNAGEPYWLVVLANTTGTTKDIWNLSTTGQRLVYAMDPTRTGTWTYYPAGPSTAFRILTKN